MRNARLFPVADPGVGHRRALLLAPGAEAQVTGSIVGAVKDESGALVSGATMTLRGGT